MHQVKNDQQIKIPFASWHGDDELTLPFPDNWNVSVAEPADAPELSELQIKEALSHPYGTERLSVLAQGKKSAAIAVEDITRPLQVYRFLPEIIKELNNGGISSENITIILGGASHRPMNDMEMRKKLGQEVVDQFKIIMHDFMGPDIAYLGWIKGGPVYINKYFIQAELKICVGSVLPHVEVGFSGGAKLVVPGLAGRLTIAHLHGALKGYTSEITGTEIRLMAKRAWAEEVAKFIHVDAVVCGVINSKRQIAGLFIGDIIQPHRKAAKMASDIGKTTLNKKIAREADIVITNAYPLDTDPVQMGKTIIVAKK
jgi:lactate racemase